MIYSVALVKLIEFTSSYQDLQYAVLKIALKFQMIFKSIDCKAPFDLQA